MGTWGYVDSEAQAVTALIPVIIGIILLLVNNSVKKENKIIAHIAVLLTFIVFIGLIMPLKGSIERDKPRTEYIYDEIIIMLTIKNIVFIIIISSALALISFIKSFIKTRKERESK